MNVRCGRCRSEFEVTGPGRYQCPACGSANEVRAENPQTLVTPPPPPEPDAPSPRVSCHACGFDFIVGDVAEAPCPNCLTPVTVSGEEASE